MTPYPGVLVVPVPPVGTRLQRETRRKGPLWKAVCAGRDGLTTEEQVTLLAGWAEVNRVDMGWRHDARRDKVPHIDLWGYTAKRLRLAEEVGR